MTTKILKGLKTLDDAKKFLIESKDPAVRKAGRAVVGTLDRHEVAVAVKTKRELAEGLCKRAKLPKEAVTPYFLSLLTECRDEKHMMEAIEDRRQITGVATSPKPRSVDPSAVEDVILQEALSDEERDKKQKELEAEFLKDVFRMPAGM